MERSAERKRNSFASRTALQADTLLDGACDSCSTAILTMEQLLSFRGVGAWPIKVPAGIAEENEGKIERRGYDEIITITVASDLQPLHSQPNTQRRTATKDHQRLSKIT